MENSDIQQQGLDANDNDDQVRSLQQRVKQLELQNQLLQQNQVDTQQTKFNLNDVQLIDLCDAIIDQGNEDSW